MENPKIIGRYLEIEGEEEDERLDTIAGPKATVTHGLGGITVQLFASKRNEDRGGVVLRIQTTPGSDECYSTPTATKFRDGVDLCVGGESEGFAFLLALRKVLENWKDPNEHKGLESVSVEYPLGDILKDRERF